MRERREHLVGIGDEDGVIPGETLHDLDATLIAYRGIAASRDTRA